MGELTFFCGPANPNANAACMQHCAERLQTGRSATFFYLLPSRRLTQDGEDWQLFDYKTNRISQQDLENAAQQYRRQMEIYALYLHGLYPNQVSYKATIYFNHIDRSHTLTFTAAQLLQAQEEIEQLIARITQLDFPAVSDRASTFEEQ
jgi:RecB family exonuclease